MPVALERKRRTNNPRTYRSLTCVILTAQSLLTPHRTRLDPPSAVLSELAVRKRLNSTVITKNQEIPGQATAGQLQAAALSVCAIYQSAGTVPCFVHLVFAISRGQPNSSTMLPSEWTRQPQNTNERPIRSTTANIILFFNANTNERPILSTTIILRIIFQRFPSSNNLLLHTSTITLSILLR